MSRLRGRGSAEGEVIIVCYGEPAPQGSKRNFGTTRLGRTVMVESSEKVTPWRADVMTGCRLALEQAGFPAPMDGPIVARMIFTFNRPRSHYRTGRNAHLVRAGAPSEPYNPPDLSKLLRATEDALKAASVIRDDARIVEYTRLLKCYANEDPEALDRQGVVITLDCRGTLDTAGGIPPLRLLRSVA
jgi:Holliday junction resolvase